VGYCASKPPFKLIHIAGTNGKGTTAGLLADALCGAGFKTGLFISPHVYRITERVQINGAQISLKNLDFYAGQVLAREAAPLNFFEVLTLAALLYFRARKVDFAVVECGIGGLKDSTNIFASTALGIITSVDIDHADILGGTIAKIAAQKAGIIKQNTPCICGPLAPPAKAAIKKSVAKNNAPLKMLPRAKNAFLQNAALALEAAKLFGVKEAQFKAAIKNFKMPARFEVCKLGRKTVIKDGAHNPAAIKEFIKTYSKSSFGKKTAALIYAASADKDYKSAAVLLRPHFKNIILTSAGAPRGVKPEILQKYFGDARYEPLENLTAKYLAGLRVDTVVVLGSFYLAAKIPYTYK
ncbi:MAG: hypothetical protein LBL61_00525, partial [Elusimicrobiota bacterium]|jgi:dihydrofolate synthase/folylpolyglutamate synthase|nr:hypothetical protein [Elusimicrobiota bacterium]